jgi:hypothetical protein
MLKLSEVQIISQLIENIETSLNKIGDSYSNKDAIEFNAAKKEMLKFQNKLSKSLI